MMRPTVRVGRGPGIPRTIAKVMRKSASGKMNAENLGKLIENDDDTDTVLEAD
jgi:hypothetical protein